MCQRLRKIDALVIEDHYYLTLDDECYYLMEYTAGQGFDFSSANSIIANLKKSPERRNKGEWRYKLKAIAQVAGYFRNIIPQNYLERVTLMPVPPSKAKDDPGYDDRMIRILDNLCSDCKGDIREFITLRESVQASHESDHRPPPNVLQSYYELDEGLCQPVPSTILVFDDMITTGAHFRACKNMLTDKFPDVEVIGIFVTRRAIEHPENEDLEF